MAVAGTVAEVKIVGSVFGRSNGERGGVSSGSAIRREEEYSTACVCTEMSTTESYECLKLTITKASKVNTPSREK